MGKLLVMDIDIGDAGWPVKWVSCLMRWDKDKPDEIKAAKKQFQELTRKGYLAYTVKKDGSSKKQIITFDEKAEQITLLAAEIRVPPTYSKRT